MPCRSIEFEALPSLDGFLSIWKRKMDLALNTRTYAKE